MRPTLVGLATGLCLICSCGKDGGALKPHSGGNPYEVLVMTDDPSLRTTIDSILNVDLPAMPQSESSFSVSHSEDLRQNQSTRYARCIVAAAVDHSLSTPRVRYERNVYARPQLIVNVTTPKTDLPAGMGRRLRRLIDRFELETGVENLKKSRNTKAGREVKKMFDIDMLVPEELVATKQGKDFLWISDNGKRSISNLCVYTYPATGLDANQLLRKRDSIMAVNIPGEKPGMHLETERMPLPTARLVAAGKERLLECRGLWSMKGDAMGGPFVCLGKDDRKRGRIVVVEAFVYAPNMKKRGLMKRLEAALYSTAID